MLFKEFLESLLELSKLTDTGIHYQLVTRNFRGTEEPGVQLVNNKLPKKEGFNRPLGIHYKYENILRQHWEDTYSKEELTYIMSVCDSVKIYSSNFVFVIQPFWGCCGAAQIANVQSILYNRTNIEQCLKFLLNLQESIYNKPNVNFVLVKRELEIMCKFADTNGYVFSVGDGVFNPNSGNYLYPCILGREKDWYDNVY